MEEKRKGEEKKPLIVLPRCYAKVCEELPPEYSDYTKNYQVPYGDIERYEIVRKIGRGKYSEVYEGIRTDDDGKAAIKILKPVKKAKIKREIKVLQCLKGGPNIVQLLDVVCDPATKTPSIIMEYVESFDTDLRMLYKKLSPSDVKQYVLEILKALDYAHSKGIMHRDIKPQNVIIDHPSRRLKLIDWGLAEFYHPGEEYNVRVASRYFKSPELLIDYGYYDYSMDIWGLGCMLAGIVFQQDPFFQGKDNNDQLLKIIKIVGTDEFFEYLHKFGIGINPHLHEQIGKHSKKPWKKFRTPENEAYATDEAIDLISRMLLIDHSQRILARDALLHPYFKPAPEVSKKEPKK